MLRALSILSIAVALLSAFLFYAINYDTRRIESEADKLSRKIERTRRDIAVLKAERALLASPKRIEPLARKLGLVPAGGHQFGSLTENASRGAGAGNEAGAANEVGAAQHE